MADQQINITLNAIDNTKKALTELQNNLKGIDKQAKEATSTFFTFSNVLKTFITAEAIRATFNILTGFQDMKVALNQVTGSIEQGSRAFDFLNKFSETSRFNIKDLSNAFILLYRSGINPTEELLKTFTNTASAARNPLETLNTLILLFTKGTEGGLGLIQFRRLESEGIPVFKILREQFGLSKNSVEEYLKTIEGSKYVFDLLRQGLGKAFGGTEAANAKNLSTTFDDVKNSAEKLLASLGDTGLNKVLSETFIILKDIIDLIKNSDFARFIGMIGSGLGKVSDFIGKGVEAYKKAKKGYEEAIGMGGKQVQQVKPPEILPDKTLIEEVYSKLKDENIKFSIQWKTINTTIAQGTVDALKSVSQGIAESIILGKKLGDTFREIAQKLLVKILSNLIEEQLIKIAILALDEIAFLIGLKKLATEKAITSEKEKQAKIDGKQNSESVIQKQLTNIFEELWNQVKNIFGDIFSSVTDIFSSIGDFANSVFGDISNNVGTILDSLTGSIGDIFNSIGGSLGDILGSVGNFFGGGGGGGGGFDLGTIIDIGSAIFGFAEGGDVKGGVPITVGERGRELFIPKTDGTIIPNQDLMGQTNISFTINATDVKGVQELLINNRATITNLINQALNQRGKPNLV